MKDYETKVMDQFVREEGSQEEVESWSNIKFRLKELEAVENRVCEFKYEYDDVYTGAEVYKTQCKMPMEYLSCFKYCPYCGGKILIKSEVE